MPRGKDMDLWPVIGPRYQLAAPCAPALWSELHRPPQTRHHAALAARIPVALAVLNPGPLALRAVALGGPWSCCLACFHTHARALGGTPAAAHHPRKAAMSRRPQARATDAATLLPPAPFPRPCARHPSPCGVEEPGAEVKSCIGGNRRHPPAPRATSQKRPQNRASCTHAPSMQTTARP